MCLVSLLFLISVELRLWHLQQGGVKHQYINGTDKSESARIGIHPAVSERWGMSSSVILETGTTPGYWRCSGA